MIEGIFTLFSYILRRIGMMFLILFGSSYLSYVLMAYSSDPLAAFGESTEKNKAFLIKQTIIQLQLDVPPPVRFFLWLRGVVSGLWGQLDLGVTRFGKQPVLEVMGAAIPVTFRLVIASTILAIFIGIIVGLLTAIRQYSRFDYSMTFVSFLLFSVPVFWFAVMLKIYLAVQFNDFLVDPTIPWYAIVITGLLVGFAISEMSGLTKLRYFVLLGVSAGIISGLLFLASASKWFINPTLGIVGVAALALSSGLVITQLSTGLRNRQSLIASMSTAAFVIACYYPFQALLAPSSNILAVVLMFVITIGAAILIGYSVQKIDRRINIRTAILTAIFATLPVVFDRFMQEFQGYYQSEAIHGRPIPTLGQSNDYLSEEQLNSFWISGLDAIMHLILPTIALTLISFAGYVRYSRASLLEVMNMDYIRTARAKGLNERTVIMRHALRNSMLPLTTILVNDFAGVIGGAIITETVFQWKGMGKIFKTALDTFDLNLFMGVFVLGAALTILANLVADLLFGVVDPRIRVRK